MVRRRHEVTNVFRFNKQEMANNARITYESLLKHLLSSSETESESRRTNDIIITLRSSSHLGEEKENRFIMVEEMCDGKQRRKKVNKNFHNLAHLFFIQCNFRHFTALWIKKC